MVSSCGWTCSEISPVFQVHNTSFCLSFRVTSKMFSQLSAFFLNSRLLNFNVFYFIFFSGTLGSFETMMGFLATLHREGINVFIAWHFYGGLGGGEDGPWILN